MTTILKNFLVWVAPTLTILILGFFFLPWKNMFIKPDQKVQVHSIVLEKIETLGKLELVKYRFQDVVKHEVIRDWFPDPKVLLFVEGEAVGCVDFAAIDSNSVVVMTDTLMVFLPAPELCYSRIDHEKSRVYDTEFTFFEEAELVDAAYAEAERQIQQAAFQADILLQTKEQAETMLRPILETLANQPVKIAWQKEVVFLD